MTNRLLNIVEIESLSSLIKFLLLPLFYSRITLLTYNVYEAREALEQGECLEHWDGWVTAPHPRARLK